MFPRDHEVKLGRLSLNLLKETFFYLSAKQNGNTAIVRRVASFKRIWEYVGTRHLKVCLKKFANNLLVANYFNGGKMRSRSFKQNSKNRQEEENLVSTFFYLLLLLLTSLMQLVKAPPPLKIAVSRLKFLFHIGFMGA